MAGVDFEIIFFFFCQFSSNFEMCCCLLGMRKGNLMHGIPDKRKQNQDVPSFWKLRMTVSELILSHIVHFNCEHNFEEAISIVALNGGKKT